MAGTYVYVIGGDHGRQKIGVSDDPRRRIGELQTGSPFPLRFAFVGQTDGFGHF
jgi:Meiotically up-regulated gene 113